MALRFREPVLPEALGMDISAGNGNRGRGIHTLVPLLLLGIALRMAHTASRAFLCDLT